MCSLVNKNKIKNSSRYLAVEILEKIETKGAYSNLLLRETISEKNLSKQDTNLLTELVYGVLQNQLLLDYQLSDFLKKKQKLDNWVRQLLRVSLYQMDFLDRIPAHAIINEAANIARIRGHRGVVGLVNAILRNIQRKGVRNPKEIKDPSNRISVQYSLPLWLINEFIEDLGIKEAEKLAASLNENPKLSLRVNIENISREEAIRELKEEGYQAEKSEISPYGIIVLNGVPTNSRLFKEGDLTVQDESSMLVAPALNVEENHWVLDAAAAPGGKTMHIAVNFLNKEKGGKITALDIHEHKINLIKENAKRQGVEDIVSTKQMDAREVLDVFPKETFDRVLLDAPCSGLGLMRRRPEIRYNKTKEDILSLQKLQLELLNAVSQVLKPGGEMIYSTCTITHLENQEVVAQFLKENKDFVQIDVPTASEALENNTDGSLMLYPHQYDTDGFYIAHLKKIV